MITELYYPKLIPAVWAIASHNNVDVGVARSMLQNNIRHGKEIDGMAILPDDYMPDWAALKEDYDATPVDAGVNSNFNVFSRIAQACYVKLCALWREGRYAEMITLIEGTEDPGPISGPARKEWEDAKKEAEEGETTEPAE